MFWGSFGGPWGLWLTSTYLLGEQFSTKLRPRKPCAAPQGPKKDPRLAKTCVGGCVRALVWQTESSHTFPEGLGIVGRLPRLPPRM